MTRQQGWTFALSALGLTAGLLCVSGCRGEPYTATSTAPGSHSERTAPVALAAIQADRSALGLNLAGIEGFIPVMNTLDLMKTAGPWLTQCHGWKGGRCADFNSGASGWDTREQHHLRLDPQGWILALPSESDEAVRFRFVSTVVATAQTAPSGKYVVAYEGAGTLTYSQGATKSSTESRSGRDVIQYDNSKGMPFILSVTTIDSSNPVRNISVVPAGGYCEDKPTKAVAVASECDPGRGAYVSYEAAARKSIWNPALLADLKGWRTLRLMDWAKTNTSMLQQWPQRPRIDDRTWAGSFGAPVEAMLDIANQANADPWITLPTQADDEYVRNFASLALRSMRKSAHLNLEYSNESWNDAFAGAQWMSGQARAKWPEEVAKGTGIASLRANWYALRTVEVCRIAKAVFGAEQHRVRCIAASQSANAWLIEQMLKCDVAAKSLGSACARHFDAVATAPYFGHYLAEAKHREKLNAWLKEPDGGVSKLFEELLGQNDSGQAVRPPLARTDDAQPASAVAQARQQMVAAKAVADRFSLPLWAYEGGQHMVPPHDDPGGSIQTLFKRANTDPRMGRAYRQMLADWHGAGGQTFAAFSHVSQAGRWGYWGAKQTLDDEQAPKWQALLHYRDSVGCWWKDCAQ